MVGASKILTVSYGTFSCTLEGFDDPFSTMRGIAEYFRDLAADDRYFGAEPPTPDAEMLHQIAQREVKRRVEAQIEDNGITLRQVERREPPRAAESFADDDAGENMFADIGVDESSPAGDADDEAEAAEAASLGAYGDAEPVDIMPAAFEDNSVAAKLSRIRAVVSRGAGAAAAPTAFSGPIQKAFEGPTPTAAHGSAKFPEPAPEPTADPVVEAAPDDERGTASTPEPETEEASAPEMSGTAAHEQYPEAKQLGAESASAPEEAAPLENDTDATLAAYDEADPWAASPAEILAQAEPSEPETTEPEATKPGPETVEDTSLAARIVRLKRAALGDTRAAPAQVSDTAHPVMPDAAQARAEGPAAAPDAADAAGEPQPTDGDALFAAFDAADTADHDRTDAGPIREEEDREIGLLHPAEADEEEDDLDLDVDDLIGRRKAPEPEETPVEDVTPESDEQSEAESLAAMKAAIAEATSAFSSHTADDDAEESDDSDVADEPHRHSPFEQRDQAGDAAFDRILEQTNSRMDDSEGNRRRSAIAHLKAAVAATKADRLLKRIKEPAEQDAEDQSQYRDDLAKVVRPRRTATEPRERTERPETLETKTSPLMLVSELRVDEDGADKADMIAPRRVNSELRDFEEGEVDPGFVEFAEKMGATELPDLLEAAAAYSAFVEGRKEFSRPQLMRQVASVEQGEFTREAGLRSFGQLLRQGKIQKLKRGQFTITAETRFNPEARIAGE